LGNSKEEKGLSGCECLGTPSSGYWLEGNSYDGKGREGI